MTVPQGISKKAGSRLKPTSVTYWTRFLIAIVIAVLTFLLRAKDLTVIASLTILVYLLSCVLVRYVLKYGEKDLRGRYKLVTLGGGTFLFVWLAALVLLYTIFPY